MDRKLFIFDCFGVVISDVSAIFMDKYLNAEQQLYMRQNVFRKVDVGVMTMTQMFERLASLCGIAAEQVKSEWTDCEYVLTDTVEVIMRLKEQGHCVVLLSNAAVEYVDYLFDKFRLRDVFDFEFVSSAYGCAKPDAEFYKLCVDSFDEKFEKVFFADNNPDNLTDLERFGIIPVLFTSAADFVEKVGV